MKTTSHDLGHGWKAERRIPEAGDNAAFVESLTLIDPLNYKTLVTGQSLTALRLAFAIDRPVIPGGFADRQRQGREASLRDMEATVLGRLTTERTKATNAYETAEEKYRVTGEETWDDLSSACLDRLNLLERIAGMPETQRPNGHPVPAITQDDTPSLAEHPMAIAAAAERE